MQRGGGFDRRPYVSVRWKCRAPIAAANHNGRQIDALIGYHAIVPCTRTFIGIVGPDWMQLQHGAIVYHATVSRTWASASALGTMQ